MSQGNYHVMELNNIGKHRIKYEDFNFLLSSDCWLINKRMKDNWTPQDHLEHIDNVVHFNPYCIVDFYVDNDSLKKVQTIDVYITHSKLEYDIPSKTHHIQFIKDYRQQRTP